MLVCQGANCFFARRYERDFYDWNCDVYYLQAIHDFKEFSIAKNSRIKKEAGTVAYAGHDYQEHQCQN
jgi:hypothetical protein